MQDSDDDVSVFYGPQSYALYITGDENATTDVSKYLAKVSAGMLHSPQGSVQTSDVALPFLVCTCV